MPIVPEFLDPGTYIRYYDNSDKEFKYLRLLEKVAPLKYPKRFPVLAAGAKGDAIVFDELNPSDTKKHRYCAYIGVKPGIQVYVNHPYDQKTLKWDEQISDISEDDTANIEYDDSPYDAPEKCVWIERDRYPGIYCKNKSQQSICPEIIWLAAMYLVKEQAELSESELAGLKSGSISSVPITFGGLI